MSPLLIILRGIYLGNYIHCRLPASVLSSFSVATSAITVLPVSNHRGLAAANHTCFVCEHIAQGVAGYSVVEVIKFDMFDSVSQLRVVVLRVWDFYATDFSLRDRQKMQLVRLSRHQTAVLLVNGCSRMAAVRSR